MFSLPMGVVVAHGVFSTPAVNQPHQVSTAYTQAFPALIARWSFHSACCLLNLVACESPSASALFGSATFHSVCILVVCSPFKFSLHFLLFAGRP